MKYKIGIDIGGTNTDAVLVDEKSDIIASTKTSTTAEIDIGFQKVLSDILQQTNVPTSSVEGIFLGTTHATNAILQQQDLYRVGVIRLAGHMPDSIPSCYAWPQEMKKAIYVDTETVNGGFECQGEPITPLDLKEVEAAIERLIAKGSESLAIIGTFSPLNSEQELAIKNLVKDKIPVSLSHQIGGIGFLERENSTILNAALKKVMATGFKRLEKVLIDLKINCPLWITQNNGSIIDLAHAIEYPVLTISAGPTNSFIGGTKLTQLKDAIVVDIGGTSTDAGVVRKGYPRRCINNSKIGGISLNFSMPDVLSIALGGGSHIAIDDDIRIGPVSCSRKTLVEGVSFGGSQLTLTDIALSLGHVKIPGADPQPISKSQEIMEKALESIHNLIAKVGVDEQNLPVVMIGGGASLLPKLSERFLTPHYASVANAYGAALAEISATLDTVVSLVNRQATIERLQAEVIKNAIEKGADSKNVDIVDMQIIPYHYVPNSMARVIITASGQQASSLCMAAPFNTSLEQPSNVRGI